MCTPLFRRQQQCAENTAEGRLRPLQNVGKEEKKKRKQRSGSQLACSPQVFLSCQSLSSLSLKISPGYLPSFTPFLSPFSRSTSISYIRCKTAAVKMDVTLGRMWGQGRLSRFAGCKVKRGLHNMHLVAAQTWWTWVMSLCPRAALHHSYRQRPVPVFFCFVKEEEKGQDAIRTRDEQSRGLRLLPYA